MRELLYLKDEQLKQFIEKIFIGYQASFSDAKRTLENHSIGIAHHKVIHLISSYKGITISGLLKKLKVTKQSLNRVLRDLIKSKMIKQIKDENDTRKKNLFLEKDGKKFFDVIYNSQKRRIFNALKNSEPDSVVKFKKVLERIIDGK